MHVHKMPLAIDQIGHFQSQLGSAFESLSFVEYRQGIAPYQDEPCSSCPMTLLRSSFISLSSLTFFISIIAYIYTTTYYRHSDAQ